MGVDGSEDAKSSSTSQQVEEGEGASNFELPWRKEKGTLPMLDFQRRFPRKVGVPEGAFGSAEFLSDRVIGQSGRFIGKRGCRRSPAGRDRVARCQLPGLIEVGQVKHVLVPVELERQSGTRP